MNTKNGSLFLACLAGLIAVAGCNQPSQPSQTSPSLSLEDVNALIEGLEQTQSSELAKQILNSLGQFEFPNVAGTFEQYLSEVGRPSEMRVAAVEALSKSSTEAVPFLMRFVENDNDAEVRASAAWAISTHFKVNNLGPTLSRLAEREPSSAVRQRLYEALLPQDVIPAERLLPHVQAETEIAARVAGFNAIGRAVYQQPGSPVTLAFDQQIVPELAQIATRSNDLNIQMRAVFALRRARTPAANAALKTIAYNAGPQIAAAARNGLR